jgi:polysaccharide export outer membrane protein
MTNPSSKPTRGLIVLGLLLAFGLLWVGCQKLKPVYQDVPASPIIGDAFLPADTHVFQIGELVTIYYREMRNAPQPHEERIKEDGTITLPLIGSIAVAGKTPREVQKELQEKHPRYFGYFRPYEYVYYVGGEVGNPGPKAYLGKTTVTGAIQAAGDFTKAANTRKVKLIRPDGRSEIITDLLRMHSGHDPEVYPGDKIEVARKWWH